MSAPLPTDTQRVGAMVAVQQCARQAKMLLWPDKEWLRFVGSPPVARGCPFAQSEPTLE